ncbi:MAG: four helix bundle protein [Bacteroidales bacterium]|nr:four helix bundle protein [Bacteroidales bacterium]
MDSGYTPNKYEAMKVGFRELDVYQMAYKMAMDVFEMTKTLPGIEKYSLIDQIQRSSYISTEIHDKHIKTSESIGRMLYQMIKNPKKFQDKR